MKKATALSLITAAIIVIVVVLSRNTSKTYSDGQTLTVHAEANFKKY